MAARGFALFETPIGRCGVVWGDRGIVGLQLPEGREVHTRARLRQQFPDFRETPPPPDVQHALDRIAALMRGETIDLSTIPVDMDRVPPFHRQVYEAVRRIPAGTTMSYGEVATGLGNRAASRTVGQALGRNPLAILVPCHRVVAASGKVGGLSANGAIATKLRLLAIEGARKREQPTLFAGDGQLAFDARTAVEHVRTSDRALARVIEASGPFQLRLKDTPSIFVALAEAIVYQQLSGRAAATIFSRVCALFPEPEKGPTPEQILRIADEKLRGAGLSRPKMLSLRDLALRAERGEIPTLADAHRLDDEAIVERLTQVRGIGRWTVEMLLIFRLGRPDVLPLDDYGVRKGFAIAMKKRELPARADLERRGERWRPYRTVASWYLWRAVDLASE